jgi:hypothetical protein
MLALAVLGVAAGLTGGVVAILIYEQLFESRDDEG